MRCLTLQIALIIAKGGKKDAKYIAKVIMPHIKQIESEEDILKRKPRGIVDLVFF